MKKIIFTLIIILLSTFNVFSQYCSTNNRFTETPVFTNEQIESNLNVVYGTSLNYNGQNQILLMNIFHPKFNVDPLQKRPLIVLMHGGSFLTGSLNDLNLMCIEFAKRGFVAATIEYRLGWNTASDCEGVNINTVVSANKAIYRSIQDVNASLRYLVHNSNSYKIDTTWIFVGGQSAGSFTTSDLAFVTQQQLFTRWPYVTSLGHLNTSGNNLTETFTIKGLFHNWGSIIDVDYITQYNALPIIGFAGDMDITSPIDSGYFQNCTSFELMWGTRAIYNKIKSYGVCADLTVKLHGGHGVYNQTYDQNIFRIGKASCFFKSLFCGDCQTPQTTDSIPADCGIHWWTIGINFNENTYIESMVNEKDFYIFKDSYYFYREQTPIKLTISDKYGKIILEKNIKNDYLDLSYLKGTYFLKIETIYGIKDWCVINSK